MIVNVYLHKEIVDTLKCFGTLSDTVNNILKAAVDGYFDVMDKPACPDKDNCQHYRIDITEPEYLELYKTYGSTNQRISLRRLLYWFVDNEVYNDIGWTVCNIQNDTQILFQKRLDTAISYLNKAAKIASSTNKHIIWSVIEQLKEIV